MALRRIILQSPPRQRSLLEHAQFLLHATSQLQTLDQRLEGFRLDLGNRRGAPLSTAEALVDELEQRKLENDETGIRQVRYRVMIAVPEGRRIRAHMSLACGYDEADGDTTNGRTPICSTVKFSWMGRAAPTPSTFRRMLTTLVNLYRPLWATLGGAFAPSPRVGHSGTPSVGWDTFLARQLGPLPQLDDKVVITPWGALGSVVRAFPEVLNERDKEHLAALVELQRRLHEAGNLKPVADLEEVPAAAPIHSDSPESQSSGEGDALAAKHGASVTEAGASTDPDFADFVPLPFKEALGGAIAPPTAVPIDDSPDKGGTMDIHSFHQDHSEPNSGAQPADPLMASQQITVYAKLHAELAVAAEPRAMVYVRYGVRDDAHLTDVNTWWEALFASEPLRYAQWSALYQKYTRELGKPSPSS